MAAFPLRDRHTRSASLSIHDREGDGAGLLHQRSVEPRSPPNTSHVPCKFFRQGACQAGSACPFSHDIGAAAETICKYFNKGNCKFGPKCANIHMLPNGKRVNYHKHGFTIGDTPLNLTGRSANGPMPMPVPYGPSPSALTSMYRGENGGGGQTPGSPYQPPTITTSYGPYGEDRLLDGSMLDMGAPYSTNGSVFGSPRDDDVVSRLGLALSPMKGLSVLDAPLPASFDSNGISNAARFPAAPWSSSMPTKFGLDSPSPSLNIARDTTPSEALRMLHTSAFYGSDQLAPTPSNPSTSPPPNGPTGDEFYDRKRILHSSRFAKPRMISASVPKTVDHDWDHDFSFVEEDYVPKDLSDLLTPAEKARRGSTRDDDPGMGDGMRFGSPGAASPSRWGPLFQKQREEEFESQSPRPPSKFPPATFGHVGSPLRNSSLAHEMSNNAASINGTSPRPSPGMRSGPISGPDSLSALTQQLQRSKLSEAIDAAGNTSHSPMLHPNSAATRNIGAIGRERVAIERHVSNGSTGSRAATPKDDDDPQFVFNMEEDEPQREKIKKRTSSGLATAQVWSYAGVVAGRGTPTSSTTATNVTATVHQEQAAPRPIGGR